MDNIMFKTISFVIFFIFFVPNIFHAEIKTYTHTVKQAFGGSQSPDDARVAAISKAKREVLEKAGTYLETLTIIKSHMVEKDEITALAAGILNTVVVSEKRYATDDAYGIIVTVKVDIDSSIFEERIKNFLQDQTLLKKYSDIQKRENQLLARIEALEEKNRILFSAAFQKQDPRKDELERQFQKVSQRLRALSLKKKALDLWRDGEYTDPVKAIYYLNKAVRMDPHDTDIYINRGFAYANLGKLGSMCSDFRRACELGDCSVFNDVSDKGDCR